MAIPYIAARFMRMKECVGPCAMIAYLARSTVFDRRTKKRFDFRRHGGDVVFEAVWLPDGASPNLTHPATLANSMQEAEKSRTLREDRQRFPQFGLSLVIALPPDREVTLDEAIALVRRIVDAIRGTWKLAAYIAIHEPRLRQATAHSPNRHAHVILSLREVTGSGFSRRKTREIVARVRTMSKARRQQHPARPPHYVAEGVDWPDLSWTIQNRFFLELGLDLRVQPIAAVPQKHWSKLTWSHNAKRVSQELAELRRANLSYALGDEPTLVKSLLRGRSTLLRRDLEAFLERYIDGDAARRDRLDAILAHPDILECVVPREKLRADRITTREIHEELSRAVEAVDRHVTTSDLSFLMVRESTKDMTAAVVRSAIENLVTKRQASASARPLTQVVVCGSNLSHVDSFTWISELALPCRYTTLSQELAARLETWSPDTLVVLPRAEQIADIDLARVINEADQRGTDLIVGVDAAHADGIVDRRLILELWKRFHSSAMAQPSSTRLDEASLEPKRIHDLLQHGFISEATVALEKAHLLTFSSEPPAATITASGTEDADRSHLIVFDDPRLVEEYNRRIRERRRLLGTGAFSASQSQGLDDGMFILTEGDPIIMSTTDYSILPPVLRKGQLVHVAGCDPASRLVELRLATGEITKVKGRCAATLNPAYAFSIREAYFLKDREAPMTIYITRQSKAWAALLLATSRLGKTQIKVSPLLAKSSQELCTSIESSLPSALSTSFTVRASVDAQASKALDELLVRVSSDLAQQGGAIDSSGVEEFPRPDLPTAPFHISAFSIKLRDLFQEDDAIKNGLTWLCQHLADPATSKILIQKINSKGSSGLRALVQALVPHTGKSGRRLLFSDDVDLPHTLKGLESLELAPFELHTLRQDLRMLPYEARQWNGLPQNSAENRAPVIRMDR
jgi:hypothetical protein